VSWTCPSSTVTPGTSVEMTYTISSWSGGTPSADAVKFAVKPLDSSTPSGGVATSWATPWKRCSSSNDTCTRRTVKIQFSPIFLGAKLETRVGKTFTTTSEACAFRVKREDGGGKKQDAGPQKDGPVADAPKKADAKPKKDAGIKDIKQQADAPLKDKEVKGDVVYCDLASTTSLYPVADAYIRGGKYQNSNYGKASNLFVKSRTFLDDFSRKIYLAFDVSSVTSKPKKATLSLTIAKHPSKVSMVHGLFGITDNKDWNPATLGENAITWANAPKNNTFSAHLFLNEGKTPKDAVRLLASQTVNHADPPGTVYSFDVSSYVLWALGHDKSYSTLSASDADKKITFMVSWTAPTSANIDGYSFASREASCGRPLLTIQ